MQIRTLTALLTTAAIASGGGLGIAQAATSAKSGTTASQTQRGPGGKHRGPTAAQTAALAKTLGVTTAQLKAAEKTVRAALDADRPARPARPTTPPTAEQRAAHEAEHKARHAAFAAALAKELGLDATTVTAALEAARPAKH